MTSEFGESAEKTQVSVRDFVSTGPFSLMRRLSEELDRVSGELALGRGETLAALATRVAERDGKYIVRTDLSGLKPTHIKVEVAGNALVIEGETRWANGREVRGEGTFVRSIPLPEGVKPDDIHVTLEHGVLEVSVPISHHPGSGEMPAEISAL